MMEFNRDGTSRRLQSTGFVGVLLALALSLTFAGSSSAATPTPVLLGTADPFAVLAGSGIFNTGATTITGDTGSTPVSSQSGFTACPAADCVSQTGTNHASVNPNDSVTQTAKTDAATAYSSAAGQTPAVVLTELAGQVLPAGIYNSASGTFGMNGTLVLDGQDNLDAIFIFQTASTLITGPTGNVSLIRGAQACNIFWQVGSAATLAAGSTLRGTVMAHDDISLADGVTVDGRLLAGNQPSGVGTVTLAHDTITRPTTCLRAAATTSTPVSPAIVTGPTAADLAVLAARAAADAAAKAAAAKAAKLKAAKLKAAKAKAAKAKAAKAKAAKLKAARKRAAAVKAATARRAAAKKRATSITNGFAKPPLRPFGFTG